MPYNIVLLTMSMNIGGAETHLYELALALQREGHSVVVFSNGGMLADKLQQQGVTHINAPLHKRSVSHMARAYRIIKEYIRQHPCDVIHSHTRISNYVAKQICNEFNIPLVTTVHGKFKTGFWARIFSKWGNRSLAVSEDLKTYLSNNYNYDPKKIRLTVNGINLSTFCKTDDLSFKKEIGLSETHKMLLLVSRLDHDTVDHVYRVFRTAPQLYAALPQTRIVIVGDGNAFDALQKAAEQINGATAPDFIRLIGPSSEAHKYYQVADAFVGMSRSALEAMACKVPTLLLGNFGYIGRYCEQTKKDCIETNFTCRGCPFPEDDVILQEILQLLQNPSQCEQSVREAYELIQTQYAVDNMKQDALASYREAWDDCRAHPVMICGYYGKNNFGDDITLRTLVKNTKAAIGPFRPIVLTHHAKPYREDNFICIHRFNLPKIIHYMKKTKCLVLGGGSLLQDATSNRSFLYYTTILRLAIRSKCRTMLYGNGIGPVGKARHQKTLQKLLNRVDIIALRDDKSLELVTALGIDPAKVMQTADETFTMDPTQFTLPDNSVLQQLQSMPQKKLLINLRQNKNAAQYAVAIEKVCEQNDLVPVLMPIYYKQDIDSLRKLKKSLRIPSLLIDQPLSGQETIAVLQQCDTVLAERLHLIIFSALLQKPFVALSYDPKVSAMADQLQMSRYCIATEQADAQLLLNTLQDLLENQDDLRQLLGKSTAALQQKAAQNHKALCALLEKEI